MLAALAMKVMYAGIYSSAAESRCRQPSIVLLLRSVYTTVNNRFCVLT